MDELIQLIEQLSSDLDERDKQKREHCLHVLNLFEGGRFLSEEKNKRLADYIIGVLAGMLPFDTEDEKVIMAISPESLEQQKPRNWLRMCVCWLCIVSLLLVGLDWGTKPIRMWAVSVYDDYNNIQPNWNRKDVNNNGW